MSRELALVVAGTCLVAGTYGLVRLAYGLFLPDIRASLSMSSAVAGYVSAGASVAYCVGALCGLVAADRSRRLVLGALVTAAVGSAGMALAPGMSLFVPCAIVSSTGAGLASPGLVAVVERNVAAARVARSQAIVNAGTGPGLVVAGLLALVLLPEWRLGFAVSAAFTAAAGLGVLLLDRAVEPEGARRPHSDGRDRGWVLALGTPAAAALLLGAASAVVWTYGRTQVIAEGAGDSASTVAWVALGVGGSLTVLTTRPLSAMHPARAWRLTVAGVAAATAALGLAAGHLPVALLACAVFGWGFVAASSALIAWAAYLVPQRTAPGTSLLFVTLILGQAIGSAAAGAVSDRHGLSAAFVLAAGVAVLAALWGRGYVGCMEPVYTATAASTGEGRNGHVQSSDGILDLEVRTPKEMGGEGGATNPEQLFAAGYAACFHSALKSIGKRAGADLSDSEVVADVSIGENGEGGFMLAVELEVTLANVPREQAQELVEKAHEVCPYSNATRGNIEVKLTVS